MHTASKRAQLRQTVAVLEPCIANMVRWLLDKYIVLYATKSDVSLALNSSLVNVTQPTAARIGDSVIAVTDSSRNVCARRNSTILIVCEQCLPQLLRQHQRLSRVGHYHPLVCYCIGCSYGRQEVDYCDSRFKDSNLC